MVAGKKSSAKNSSNKNENKTKPTKASVEKFLNQIEHEKKREEAFVLLELFKSVTKMEPKMWGDSIIGFGSYHYKYDSGREGDILVTGFSPRKSKHSLYLMAGFNHLEQELKQLGKHKKSVGCLYVNKLDDIDLKVLKKMIQKSLSVMKKNYEVTME